MSIIRKTLNKLKLVESRYLSESYEDYVDSVCKKAKEMNYFEDVFKKVKFVCPNEVDVRELKDNYISAELAITAENTSDIGITFDIVIEDGEAYYTLIPYDFTDNLGMEAPFADHPRYEKEILKLNDGLQKHNPNELKPALVHLVGEQMAGRVLNIVNRFVQRNYGKIKKILRGE
jgi:hypothetical protein